MKGKAERRHRGKTPRGRHREERHWNRGNLEIKGE
jgi:hypothetical protein